MLLREGDRRPEMLRQRLLSGLLGAFYLQYKLDHESQPTALMKISDKQQKMCICNEIYGRFILSSKSQCNKILSSLLDTFKCSSQLSAPLRALVSDNAPLSSPERIQILCFMSEIIVRILLNFTIDFALIVSRILFCII